MMETMELFWQFIYILFPTCGFCILFKVPTKKFPPCILVGALSWTCYQVTLSYGDSSVLACFLASCLVGLLSDICSRVFKEAATIFIIPGILCLVPGSGMYRTMLALLDHDMDGFASTATNTLMAAGAIAVGLLVVGSVIRVVLMGCRRLQRPPA